MQSDLPMVRLDETRHEQYQQLIDDCFFALRQQLNVQPYDKQSRALEPLPQLLEHTWLHLHGDDVVCAVSLPPNKIRNVVVHPRFQRQGYGRRLMHAALAQLQQRGDSPIRLNVAKVNHHAHALYESLGFVCVDEFVVHGENVRDEHGNVGFEESEQEA